MLLLYSWAFIYYHNQVREDPMAAYLQEQKDQDNQKAEKKKQKLER